MRQPKKGLQYSYIYAHSQLVPTQVFPLSMICISALKEKLVIVPFPYMKKKNEKNHTWGERGSNSRPQDNSEAMRPTR